MERGWKPNDDDHHQITPNCPRCGCSNTKFCYYNNYSLTQPRYFCKGCRRYWTKGGSLRNVPVGGGCRKNRRGKSLRLSTTTTEGAIHSKSLGYGGGHSGTTGHNSYGINSSLGADNSTSSSVTQDGSRIDLALVYANFLNQKPESKTGSDELPELPSEFDLGLDFSSIANMNIIGGTSSTSIQLMEENGVVGSLGICHTLSDLSIENCSTNDHMYFSGLDPIFNQKQHHHHQEQRSSTHDPDHHVQYALSHDHDAISDFGLPPLPGQEALWSSTSQMSMASHHHHHTMQAATPLLGVPADQAHDPNLLIAGSWSPFDLPCDEAFSRTS